VVAPIEASPSASSHRPWWLASEFCAPVARPWRGPCNANCGPWSAACGPALAPWVRPWAIACAEGEGCLGAAGCAKRRKRPCLQALAAPELLQGLLCLTALYLYLPYLLRLLLLLLLLQLLLLELVVLKELEPVFALHLVQEGLVAAPLEVHLAHAQLQPAAPPLNAAPVGVAPPRGVQAPLLGGPAHPTPITRENFHKSHTRHNTRAQSEEQALRGMRRSVASEEGAVGHTWHCARWSRQCLTCPTS